jgi:hypothetical protein
MKTGTLKKKRDGMIHNGDFYQPYLPGFSPEELGE